MGYTTSKQNPISEFEFSVIDDVNSMPDGTNEMQRVSGTADFSTLLVNGMELAELSRSVSSNRMKVGTAENKLYGSIVDFTLKRRVTNTINDVKRVISSDTTVTMYVPNLIEITSPKIETSQELFPYCYYKNLEIRWNADLQNKNGVAVLVEWVGSSFVDTKKNVYIRNIDILTEDNGAAVLNDKLFDNIPENAIAYITLLRGNIEVLENIQIDPYRLVAETHAILPLILIRDIAKYN